MHEAIHESIEVEVSFLYSKVLPRTFVWKNNMYSIEKVSLVHHQQQGRDKVYYFSVSDGVNFFRLSFSTDSLTWMLEEMYVE